MPTLILILLLVVSFILIKPFFIAVFLGALLAYLLYPLYLWMSKKINNSLASSLICLLVVLIIVLPSIYFVNILVQESYTLFLLIKQRLAAGFFTDCNADVCNAMKGMLENTEIKSQIQAVAQTLTGWIMQKGSNFLTSIPKFLLSLIVMLFSLYYLLKDGPKLIRKLNMYLMMKKTHYNHFFKRAKEIIHGLTFGYGVVAIIQGITGAIGFAIFGIPSPLFWGLTMMMLALIPVVGATLIWVPASLILVIQGILNSSTSGIIKGILLFVYGALFIGSVETILKPKLMGSKAKIHPMVTFLGILGGLVVFGIVGVILGPLLLGLTTVLIENYFGKD